MWKENLKSWLSQALFHMTVMHSSFCFCLGLFYVQKKLIWENEPMNKQLWTEKKHKCTCEKKKNEILFNLCLYLCCYSLIVWQIMLLFRGAWGGSLSLDLTEPADDQLTLTWLKVTRSFPLSIQSDICDLKHVYVIKKSLFFMWNCTDAFV